VAGATEKPPETQAPRQLVSLAMYRTLVLNATNDPLSVVSGRRGALLVLAEKADPVHESGDQLRSERCSLLVPSVIRLRYFVQVPFHGARAISRHGIFARDDFTCQYCGGKADSIDHVRPRSRGGGHTWDNVVAACRPCNTRKRDRLLSELSMRLRRSPSIPTRSTLLAAASTAVPEHWCLYLGVDRRRTA